MSKIKYCSLEEAWGSTSNPQKNEIYYNNENKELNDNPLRTPNNNYECNHNIPKVENDYYFNTRPQNNKVKKQYDELYENMDDESKDLYSFIDTLNLTEKNRKRLLKKIKNVIDSIVVDNSDNHNYEKYSSSEHFTNPYYSLQNENKPTDILFLILLGVFLLFMMDKK